MESLNPWAEDYHERLYEIYRWYRENAPVHWEGEPLPSTQGSWYLFRYADVNMVLKDPRFVREYSSVFPESAESTPEPDPTSSADQPPTQPPDTHPAGTDLQPTTHLASQPLTFWDMASRWMLFRDPPDHTRLRRLVNKAFTPRAVESVVPRVKDIALELLQPGLKDGGMDLIEAFAFPLPVIVIAEMLGVPPQDRTKFRSWSNAMAAALDSYWTEEIFQRASQATGEIWEYLTHIIEERRKNLGSDLLSALINARENDDRLSEDELVAMAILLLVAGHETTVNLVGNGTLALLQHPDQMELLRREPRRAPQAVEELLRYDAPVQMTSRFAATNVPLGNHVIRKGDNVVAVIGAANRDPEVNPNPDRLDITRTEIHHLGFGGGIHYCVGAPLARREAQIALTTLLAEAPSLRLACDKPTWRPGAVFRGLQSLPVKIG